MHNIFKLLSLVLPKTTASPHSYYIKTSFACAHATKIHPNMTQMVETFALKTINPMNQHVKKCRKFCIMRLRWWSPHTLTGDCLWRLTASVSCQGCQCGLVQVNGDVPSPLWLLTGRLDQILDQLPFRILDADPLQQIHILSLSYNWIFFQKNPRNLASNNLLNYSPSSVVLSKLISKLTTR